MDFCFETNRKSTVDQRSSKRQPVEIGLRTRLGFPQVLHMYRVSQGPRISLQHFTILPTTLVHTGRSPFHSDSGIQSPFKFSCMESPYLPPETSADSTTSRIAFTSSGASSSSAPREFSSARSTLRIPGIGTTAGVHSSSYRYVLIIKCGDLQLGCSAMIQARVIWLGVALYFLAMI